MVKVNNKDTLRLVTHRFMKMNRKRNTIAMIAIALTALLFTSLFTGSESLILSKRAIFPRSSTGFDKRAGRKNGESARKREGCASIWTRNFSWSRKE